MYKKGCAHFYVVEIATAFQITTQDNICFYVIYFLYDYFCKCIKSASKNAGSNFVNNKLLFINKNNAYQIL